MPAMARKFEETVERLHAALQDPTDAAHRRLIAKTLQGRQGYLISLAARAVRPGDEELIGSACDAFARLCDDPIKRDPQCHGKVAIAQALYDHEIRADAVFVAGVAHVQLEPVLGGRQDTAAQLRGICLMALVHAQHPRALVFAAVLIADPERAARLAAVRALVASGRPDVAEPIVRLRLAGGEDDPEVLSDCMSALLGFNAAENIPWLGALVGSTDLMAAEAAALALGSSRAEAAWEILRDHAEQSPMSDRRRTVLLAIAMLRSDVAWQHLIELVMDGSPGEAADAVDALATFREQSGLRDRVEAAAMERGDADLSERAARMFSLD